MAIRNIKEIIDNKGYVVSSRDRAIFQEEDLQSFFGLSDNDAIEFILYDVNDNQLPQNLYGNVRYIPLTTDNISDYILISDGTTFSKNQLPSEYFIDVERLVREAGYNNGIFKIQITLINRRIGSDALMDKLWIQEISPSRNEIRLLPLERSNNIEELKKRFAILYKGADFRDDIIPYLSKFLDNITSVEARQQLVDLFKSEWVIKFKTEFKINDMDVFLTNIYTKFVEAIYYEFSNRISDITSVNYGSQKKTPIELELSKDDVMGACELVLQQCINYYLPIRDTTLDSIEDIAFNASQNEVKLISKSEIDTDSYFDTKADVDEITITNPTTSKRKTIKFKQNTTTNDDVDEVIGGSEDANEGTNGSSRPGIVDENQRDV